MTEQVMTDKERTALQLSRAREALEKVWPMIESKHTPGPWVTTGVDVYTDAELEDGGDIICEAPEGFEDSMRRWNANARLIAAAPELLAACREALDFCEAVLARYRIQEMYNNFELAIAKAEGVPDDELQRRRASAKATGEKP